MSGTVINKNYSFNIIILFVEDNIHQCCTLFKLQL